MKRSSSLLIAFAAAAVTMTSLFAIAGPQYFAKYGHRNSSWRNCGGNVNAPGKSFSLPEKKKDAKTVF